MHLTSSTGTQIEAAFLLADELKAVISLPENVILQASIWKPSLTLTNFASHQVNPIHIKEHKVFVLSRL